MAASSTTYSYLVERLNNFDLVYNHTRGALRGKPRHRRVDRAAERFGSSSRSETDALGRRPTRRQAMLQLLEHAATSPAPSAPPDPSRFGGSPVKIR